ASSRIVSARVAMVIAVGLCASSLLTFSSEFHTRLPFWIPLVLLGTFLFFSARQDLAAASTQEWAEEQAGYQVSSDGLDLLDVIWATEDDPEGVLVEHQQRTNSDENV